MIHPIIYSDPAWDPTQTQPMIQQGFFWINPESSLEYTADPTRNPDSKSEPNPGFNPGTNLDIDPDPIQDPIPIHSSRS